MVQARETYLNSKYRSNPSMRIRINYFGHFRIKFHKRYENIHLSKNANLQDLLILLIERYGETFKNYVFNPSDPGLKDDVLLNINNIPSSQLKGLKTKLNNQDEIVFMPLFTGGG
jgi:molybdopterin converting factor small subunit